MTTQFNEYRNLYTPQVQKYTTIKDWFTLIKESEYSGVIIQARNFGKKHNMYDSLKATLPAITYNFTFKEIKNNSNITGATGLLYLDVDNEDLAFDINSLDKSKIFAYYKSFGGTGYSILVRVDGMTSDNYESTYISICNNLGITFVFDKCAKKKTQFNVLSYDPNIFINYSSFVFTATDVINSLANSFHFVPHPEVIKKKKTYTPGGDQNILVADEYTIRFNNLNEIKVDGDYAVNWDGWQYVRCWLPFNSKVQEGKRNSSLLSYCNNLIWLNPHLTIAGAETILYRVNNKMCEVPVDATQIKSIVKSIFKQKEIGILKPIYNRKPRKILFAAHSELSPEQKFRLCGELMNDKKRNDSLQKINDVIELWDFDSNGKITVRAVASVAKMSKKTVAKHWSEFKEYVADLNEAMGCFKSSKRATAQSKQINDTLLSAANEVQPEALNEAVDVAYNFNDAGFNLAGINMLLNATINLPDDELIKLVVGIEDAYYNKPTGEVSIAAGGLTYKFLNNVNASTVTFLQ